MTPLIIQQFIAANVTGYRELVNIFQQRRDFVVVVVVVVVVVALVYIGWCM